MRIVQFLCSAERWRPTIEWMSPICNLSMDNSRYFRAKHFILGLSNFSKYYWAKSWPEPRVCKKLQWSWFSCVACPVRASLILKKVQLRKHALLQTAFPLQPTVSYDQSKAYYQAAAGTTYTVAAEPQFQTGLSFLDFSVILSHDVPGDLCWSLDAVQWLSLFHFIIHYIKVIAKEMFTSRTHEHL